MASWQRRRQFHLPSYAAPLLTNVDQSTAVTGQEVLQTSVTTQKIPSGDNHDRHDSSVSVSCTRSVFETPSLPSTRSSSMIITSETSNGALKTGAVSAERKMLIERTDLVTRKSDAAPTAFSRSTGHIHEVARSTRKPPMHNRGRQGNGRSGSLFLRGSLASIREDDAETWVHDNDSHDDAPDDDNSPQNAALTLGLLKLTALTDGLMAQFKCIEEAIQETIQTMVITLTISLKRMLAAECQIMRTTMPTNSNLQELNHLMLEKEGQLEARISEMIAAGAAKLSTDLSRIIFTYIPVAVLKDTELALENISDPAPDNRSTIQIRPGNPHESTTVWQHCLARTYVHKPSTGPHTSWFLLFSGNWKSNTASYKEKVQQSGFRWLTALLEKLLDTAWDQWEHRISILQNARIQRASS